jgi:AraC-like DNA-binding protein
VPAAQQSTLTWQEHFDFLLPRKEFLRADEVARALGCDERTVQRLFDDGQLFGHDLNTATGQRMHRRYRRTSVILLLAKRANYAPADIVHRLLEVIAQLPTADKALLHQLVARLLAGS